MKIYYEEMFRNGVIKESYFDLHDVPEDTNNNNEVVPKPQGISQEIQQCAKVISLPEQCKERKDLWDKKMLIGYEKKKKI